VTEPLEAVLAMASREARMANAPATEAGYFLVPRVIE
jgi:Asp-tRNA(Asn)/Glu-tRNA(Gln) amidotransferase C subunit